MQPDFATAVVVTDLLEYTSGGPAGDVKILNSQAMKDSPAEFTGKSVVGQFDGKGQVGTEITVKGAVPKLVASLLGNPVSETQVGPGAPASITPTGFAPFALTHVTKFWVVAYSADGYAGPPIATGTLNSPGHVLATGTLNWTAPVSTIPAGGGYKIFQQTELAANVGLLSLSRARLAGTVAAGITTFAIVANAPIGDFALGIPSAIITSKIFKHTFNQRYLTMAQQKGNTIEVFASTLVSSFNMSVQRGASEVINGTFDTSHAKKAVYSNNGSSPAHYAAQLTATGLGTAGYDASTSLSPDLCAFEYGDYGDTEIASTLASGFEFAITRPNEPKHSLNGKLGPSGFIVGTSSVRASANMYFETPSQYDQFRKMGLSSGTTADAVLGQTTDIRYVSGTLRAQYPSGSDWDYAMNIMFPRMTLSMVDAPVTQRGSAIMQKVEFSPQLDSNEGTDVMIEIISDEAASAITAAGTTLVIPANAIN
jgi:hypothetical protein